MINSTVSVGNQSFFHVTIAILVHLFAIDFVRVVALTIARNQTANLCFFNRFSGFPALLRLRRAKLIEPAGCSCV